MSIWLLRHLMTEHNSSGLISGRAEAKLLPDQGIMIPDGTPEKFSRIWCSTAGRCRETIALLGYSGVIYTDALLERDMGILNGMKRSAAIELMPELFIGKKVRVNAEIIGGETIEQARERLLPITEEIRLEGSSGEVLVCSHNQVLKIMTAILNGIVITDDYWQNTDIPNGRIICAADICKRK